MAVGGEGVTAHKMFILLVKVWRNDARNKNNYVDIMPIGILQ